MYVARIGSFELSSLLFVSFDLKNQKTLTSRYITLKLACPNSPAKLLSSKYEIAQPESYEYFDLSAVKTPAVGPPKASASDSASKASVQKTLTDEPQNKPAELWSDFNKETPKVKDKDKDKFEPPDEDSGGSAGTSEFQPTIKPFAATREVIDETNRGQDITREKRAVWMVHGMGQQISCETLGMLANGVMDALPDQRIKPRLRTVKIADQVLQRVELRSLKARSA